MSLFAFTAVALFFAGVESPNGKAGKTGSPGEGDCTDCHSSYALDSGPGSVSISSSDLTNWEYVPGTTYHITVTVTHSGRSAFGLGFEALQSSGANAGTLTAGTGTHTTNATVSGNSRTNIVQSNGGGTGTSGSHAFSFTWVAPATNVGNVTFYCSGMACNSTTGSSNEASDYVYSGSQVVTPSTTIGVNESVTKTSSVRLYPNPCPTNLMVELENVPNGELMVVAKTLSGQALKPLILDQVSTGKYAQVVDIHDLAAGMYIIETSINGRVIARDRIMH